MQANVENLVQNLLKNQIYKYLHKEKVALNINNSKLYYEITI